MMWWWNGYWPMHSVFGPIFMVGFIVLAGALLISVLRTMAAPGSKSSALDILKERFARGEISQAQYEEQRRVLKA
jgi:putative membrane protein